MNTRPSCYSIPSDRIVVYLWLRHTYPTGWRRLWAAISRPWR